MQTLITPAAVVEHAFGDGEYIAPEAVPEAAIVAAQESYVRPVTGDALFARLLAGDHADFTREYLAAPLALYVRHLLAPQFDLRHGPCGTVQPRSDSFTPASDTALRRSRRALLRSARRLLRRASDHLDSHRAQFPLYDPRADALKRCSTDGGFVQIR
ncbi:hypothetical protein [Alistipes sp.]|uniref:DUF6712 family protein n=1 Tax=Alistipes sp. TaxID=1872444 RepID=UPI003A88F1BB